MQVATAQEALFMACEMESSAIQLYTRALSLMEQLGRQDEPLYDHLTLMLADEPGFVVASGDRRLLAVWSDLGLYTADVSGA